MTAGRLGAGRLGLVVVTAAALQSAVLPVLLRGRTLDLVALVVALVAFRDGSARGLRVGFGAGLLLDLLGATTAVGAWSLALMAVAGGAAHARAWLPRGPSSSALVLGLGAPIVATLAVSTLGHLVGDPGPGVPVAVGAAVVTGVLTACAGPPTSRVLDRVAPGAPASGVQRDGTARSAPAGFAP